MRGRHRTRKRRTTHHGQKMVKTSECCDCEVCESGESDKSGESGESGGSRVVV